MEGGDSRVFYGVYRWIFEIGGGDWVEKWGKRVWKRFRGLRGLRGVDEENGEVFGDGGVG
jgi:hypothetical protein